MATGGVTYQVGGRRGHLCDLCSRAGRRTPATVFCKTCDGNMCNDCCVKHVMYALSKHDIMDVSDRQKEDVISGLKTLDIDTENSSDFVNTIRDTRGDTRPVRLEHLMTLDLVKTEGDEEWPFVTGMAFLPDGRLVVVDCYNKKCIVFDDKMVRKGVYNFEANPHDVTCYDGDYIAVTLNNRTIALMSVSRSNNISLVRTLRTSFPCFSISPMDDDSFVVSTFDHKDSVRTITVHGQEGHIQHAGLPDKTYKVDESKSTYIGTKNILVFTDRYNHTVYLCNIQSGSCQTVQSDKIKEPMGACPGNHGTVFVCSVGTNSILQISPQGKVVMTHDVGMVNPYAVSLSRDGARLAVSNGVAGQMMKIKVFTVSS